jgi:uncharacterized protein (DUF488 family)
MCSVLCTIGYESAALANVIAALKSADVKMVIDVRAVAASRRAGFSKTILRNSLEAEGIAYHHLRAIGTPKAGRDAARKGHVAQMEAIFSAHLETPEAMDGLAQAAAIAMEQKSALLCFEACAEGCHRRILADRINAITGCKIDHLRV